MQIRLFRRARAIGVDHDQAGAARFFARATWVMTLTCVFTGLVPQITIRSECAISSPITPQRRP